MKKSKRPDHISREDWDAVDIPELTKKDVARMQPARSMHPEIVNAYERGDFKKPAKECITIRLDTDILDYFRRMTERNGGGYQSLVNRALREYVTGQNVVEAVRDVVREELQHAA